MRASVQDAETAVVKSLQAGPDEFKFVSQSALCHVASTGARGHHCEGGGTVRSFLYFLTPVHSNCKSSRHSRRRYLKSCWRLRLKR